MLYCLFVFLYIKIIIEANKTTLKQIDKFETEIQFNKFARKKIKLMGKIFAPE